MQELSCSVVPQVTLDILCNAGVIGLPVGLSVLGSAGSPLHNRTEALDFVHLHRLGTRSVSKCAASSRQFSLALMVVWVVVILSHEIPLTPLISGPNMTTEQNI